MPKAAKPKRDRKKPPLAREVVFHVIRTQGCHPVVIDGQEVGRGILYPEVCKLLQGQLSPSTVRFQLGTLFHRGVISKRMLPAEGGGLHRPSTIYWTDPELRPRDPRLRKTRKVLYSANAGIRGQGRSNYRQEAPQGPRYAQGVDHPSWTQVRVREERKEERVRKDRERAFPWAKEDGTEEDPTLDWFDSRGQPFAATARRNPFGPGAIDLRQRAIWLISRIDTPGYFGPEYYKTKVRNDRRRQRTGK